jgi:hypothetical protein
MSYTQRISRLPLRQREAATALRAAPDDARAMSEALHSGVPMVIISHLAQRMPSAVRDIVRESDAIAA